MLSNAEKENDCNGKNNQNDAAVRRLINAGTLGVRLLLTLCCAVTANVSMAAESVLTD